MTATGNRHRVSIEADPALPIIRMTRDFDATPAELMRAHTDPELFARWVGPNGMDTEILAWDATTGGRWRYVARRDGMEFAFHGCFHDVGEDRIVQTFTFEAQPEGVALERAVFDHRRSLIAAQRWQGSGQHERLLRQKMQQRPRWATNEESIPQAR